MILTPEIMTLNKDFCFLKIWDTTRVLGSLEKKKKRILEGRKGEGRKFVCLVNLKQTGHQLFFQQKKLFRVNRELQFGVYSHGETRGNPQRMEQTTLSEREKEAGRL